MGLFTPILLDKVCQVFRITDLHTWMKIVLITVIKESVVYCLGIPGFIFGRNWVLKPCHQYQLFKSYLPVILPQVVACSLEMILLSECPHSCLECFATCLG